MSDSKSQTTEAFPRKRVRLVRRGYLGVMLSAQGPEYVMPVSEANDLIGLINRANVPQTTKPETNEKAVAAVARWMVSHGYTTGGADNIEYLLAEMLGQIWDRARDANESAADEIERLRSGLNDVRRFLENPAWGTIRYMEGSGVYEDRDRAIDDIRYALGEITA